MEDSVFRQMYTIEDWHWWFSSRRNLIKELLQGVLDEKRKNLILDIGCGTGGILAMLRHLGQTIGIDVSEYALEFCRKRDLNNICRATVADLPFKEDTFDAVVCAGVLYHQMVKDDQAVLRQMYRVCKKGGYLLVLEPAFEWLRSPHDVVEHARCRYTLSRLCSKVKRCGFKIRKASYHTFFLFPVILAIKLFKRFFLFKQVQSDLYSLPRSINSILMLMMGLENRLLSFVGLPLGSTAICLAVK